MQPSTASHALRRDHPERRPVAYPATSGRAHLTLVPDALPTVALPPIGVRGPAGRQDSLPGMCWPALAIKQFQRPGRPIIGWWEIEKAEAEACLIAWKHKLHLDGEPYTRPFGSMFFLMEVMGRPAAIVVLASSCNTWVSKARNLSRYTAWTWHGSVAAPTAVTITACARFCA